MLARRVSCYIATTVWQERSIVTRTFFLHATFSMFPVDSAPVWPRGKGATPTANNERVK